METASSTYDSAPYVRTRSPLYPETAYLQQLLADHFFATYEEAARVCRLEQYILYGTQSFGAGSRVIQGRGIEATKKSHFEIYVKLVEAIKGPEAKQAVLDNKEKILNRELKTSSS